MSKLRTNERADASLFALLLPYALAFSVFILLPIILAIGLSFTYFNVVQPPRSVGFLNYITLLTQDEIFLKFVLPNTFKYAFLVGPGGYILAFVFSWLLAQIQKGPRNILALAIYAPSMVGPVLITVVWRTIFSGNEAGIINSLLLRLELINAPIQFLLDPAYLLNVVIFVALWSSMGIGFLAMLAGVLNVDKTLYEAAYIDGVSNRFQEIIHITIPSMRPQMLFGAVMSIVNTFNIGWIGVALAGVAPTPGYSAQLIVNHIEDDGFGRYEMGYAAMVSVALLLMVIFFSRVSYILFGNKE
jgi:multiple sugar transport system permease protein